MKWFNEIIFGDFVDFRCFASEYSEEFGKGRSEQRESFLDNDCHKKTLTLMRKNFLFSQFFLSIVPRARAGNEEIPKEFTWGFWIIKFGQNTVFNKKKAIYRLYISLRYLSEHREPGVVVIYIIPSVRGGSPRHYSPQNFI